MQKIVMPDTNFLMIPYQFRVDIFAEIARICDFSYKIAILDRVVEELEKIKSEQRGRDRLAAAFALELLKRKNLKIVRTHSKKPVDDLIADYAEKGAVIATQDSALKRKIRARKGRIIFLRNRKFLKME